MMGSQKSKRVSWATDINLCQVRLFLSEDSPSQVSSGSQDHLQAKASWLLHTAGTGPDDHPPGFEGANTENQLKKELAQLSLSAQMAMPTLSKILLDIPLEIVLNPYWQVVAGEESKEADIQKERELKMLEAIYPRPSSIPPSFGGQAYLKNQVLILWRNLKAIDLSKVPYGVFYLEHPYIKHSSETLMSARKNGMTEMNDFLEIEPSVFQDVIFRHMKVFDQYGICAKKTFSNSKSVEGVKSEGDYCALYLYPSQRVGKLSTGDSLDMSPHDEAAITAIDATLKDMEGAAVAYVADLFSVPTIIIKAVTDIIDGDKPTAEEFLQNLVAVTAALDQAATGVVDFISENVLLNSNCTIIPGC